MGHVTANQEKTSPDYKHPGSARQTGESDRKTLHNPLERLTLKLQAS